MTVAELIEKLKVLPGDYEVLVLGQGGSEGCECDADISVSDRDRQVLVREEDDRFAQKLTTRAELMKLIVGSR